MPRPSGRPHDTRGGRARRNRNGPVGQFPKSSHLLGVTRISRRLSTPAFQLMVLQVVQVALETLDEKVIHEFAAHVAELTMQWVGSTNGFTGILASARRE